MNARVCLVSAGKADVSLLSLAELHAAVSARCVAARAEKLTYETAGVTVNLYRMIIKHQQQVEKFYFI